MLIIKKTITKFCRKKCWIHITHKLIGFDWIFSRLWLTVTNEEKRLWVIWYIAMVLLRLPGSRTKKLVHVKQFSEEKIKLWILFVFNSDEESDPISYSIETESLQDIFNIGVSSGSLKLLKELDAETQSRYVITISAISGNDVTSIGRCQVEILVADVNEHRPEFLSSHHTFTIEEGNGTYFWPLILLGFSLGWRYP